MLSNKNTDEKKQKTSKFRDKIKFRFARTKKKSKADESSEDVCVRCLTSDEQEIDFSHSFNELVRS